MIRFVVDGEPVPKGSKTARVVARRRPDGTVTHEAVMFDGKGSGAKDPEVRKARNRHRRSWPSRVEAEAFAARVQAGERPQGALNVAAVFYVRRPKDKRPGGPCTTKPDADKLLRAVLDPMVRAGLIRDDSWVVSFDGSRKVYDDGRGPRVEVTVAEAAWALGPLLEAS